MTAKNSPAIVDDLDTEANASLFETDSYQVVVGPSLDFDGPTPGRVLYQIINKVTNVVEREEFALPFAIRTAIGLDKDLVEVRAGDDEEDVPQIVAH